MNLLKLTEVQIANIHNEECVLNGKTHWHESTIEYDKFKLCNYRNFWWIQRRDYDVPSRG